MKGTIGLTQPMKLEKEEDAKCDEKSDKETDNLVFSQPDVFSDLKGVWKIRNGAIVGGEDPLDDIDHGYPQSKCDQ